MSPLHFITFVCLLFFQNGYYVLASEEIFYSGYKGKPLGEFQLQGSSNLTTHNIKGDVYVLNGTTLFVSGFEYDGLAPDAFFLVGSTTQPDNSGTVIPVDRFDEPIPLGVYDAEGNGEFIILRLPRDINTYRWLSVWCQLYLVSFAQINIPVSFAPPRPISISTFTGPQVRADAVYIQNYRQVYFENLDYDGSCDEAYYWVGVEGNLDASGCKALDDNFRANRIQESFVDQNVTVTLPKEVSLADSSNIGIWCQSTSRSLGRVTIPGGELNVPAYIEIPYLGKYLGFFNFFGTVSLNPHRVRGAVFSVDDTALVIMDFTFDGLAPETFVLGFREDIPGPDGDIFLVDGSFSQLGVYEHENVYVQLPQGKTLGDYKSIAVYCRAVSSSFGTLQIPNEFVPPAPHSLGPLGFNPRVHNVFATRVQILDKHTFYIENLAYDGNGVSTYFWVGVGNTPDTKGWKAAWYLSEHAEVETEEPLALPFDGIGYSGNVNVYVRLPHWLTVFDIGYLSIWCVPFRQNFGHVTIPSIAELNIPSYSQNDLVKENGYHNCEVLSPHMFHVQWEIDPEDQEIVITMEGRVRVGDYLAFGISGSETETDMIGSDVVIGWIEPLYQAGGYVKDYYLTAREQCIVNGESGNGACRDEYSSGTDDVQLEYASYYDGITTITYRRRLDTGDENGDKVIPLDRPVYITWAVGPLGADNLVLKHHIATSGNHRIDFGRPGSTCPILNGGGSDFLPPWPQPQIFAATPTTFRVTIGQSGGRRGYESITENPGWGVAWYINDLLIPIITVKRGITYVFQVFGGNIAEISASYHPFYITDDPIGGYSQATQQEKQNIVVYAGPVVGPLCEWRSATSLSPDDFDSFFEYRDAALQEQCLPGAPGVLQWTPDTNTPDTVYYQCFTHRYLGWKIEVVDELLDCEADEYECQEIADRRCIDREEVCDGWVDCAGLEEEHNCLGCEENEYECQDISVRRCIYNWEICDGFVDCGQLAEDETDCQDDPCSRKPCLNDGVCFAAEYDYICFCSANYAGSNCQIPVDGQGCESNEFECIVPSSRQCIDADEICDGYYDCGDYADEADCPCAGNQYECLVPADRKCIEDWEACDGYQDCLDNADEADCVCADNQYECTFDNTCIEDWEVCDGYQDCGDNADEADCVCAVDQYKCTFDNTCIEDWEVCDAYADCEDNADEADCVCTEIQFECLVPDDRSCIRDWEVCDNYQDCADNADEADCDCGADEYTCSVAPPLENRCIPLSYICDGESDCVDAEDEDVQLHQCEHRACTEDEFTCNNGLCISGDYICDDDNDCGDNSDEDICDQICSQFPSDVFIPSGGSAVSVDFQLDIQPDHPIPYFICQFNVTVEPGQRAYAHIDHLTVHGIAAITFGLFGIYFGGVRYTSNSPLLDVVSRVDYNYLKITLEARRPSAVSFGLSLSSTDNIDIQTCTSHTDLQVLEDSQVCDGFRHCLDGTDETDLCPCPTELVECTANPCFDISLCPAYGPSKRCEVNDCGECSAIFYEYSGRRISDAECNGDCAAGFFTCNQPRPDYFACILESYVCDGESDCLDAEDENVQLHQCVRRDCIDGYHFTCGNDLCVPEGDVCDGDNDCGDNSDEIDCVCDDSEFTCDNGNCIPEYYTCDAYDDCGDNSDEGGCEDCGPDEYTCSVAPPSGSRCIPLSYICDGESDCVDAEDEDVQLHQCERRDCDDVEFTCDNGLCTYINFICDGENDCGDNSDEDICEEDCGPDEYTCSVAPPSGSRCIPLSYICDGESDCVDAEDEDVQLHQCERRVCDDYEFTCNNGLCILEGYVCDMYNDCGDDSDEEICAADCGQFSSDLTIPSGGGSPIIVDLQLDLPSDYPLPRILCQFTISVDPQRRAYAVVNRLTSDGYSVLSFGPNESEYADVRYTQDSSLLDVVSQVESNSFVITLTAQRPAAISISLALSSTDDIDIQTCGYSDFQVLEDSLVCDGFRHCSDGRDETDLCPCPPDVPEVECVVAPCYGEAFCAAYPQALCENDYCGGCNTKFFNVNGAELSQADCDGECAPDYFTCLVPKSEDRRCIPLDWVCDSESDCLDAEDEPDDCERRECFENEFPCDNGLCVHLITACNGYNDCGDNSDEVNAACGPQLPSVTATSNIRLEETFVPELNNPFSPEFQELQANFKEPLEVILRAIYGDAFSGIEVISFRAGSVNVLFRMTFSYPPDDLSDPAAIQDNLSGTLTSVTSSGTLGTLSVMPGPVTVYAEVECGLTDFTCANNLCITVDRVCNGNDDCGDSTDEQNCDRPCDSQPCQNAGICARVPNGYSCLCVAGYTGPHCEIPPQGNVCDSQPCLNDGFCTAMETGLSCRCTQGYSGRICEIAPSNPCDSQPCQNGGFCIQTLTGFNCLCDQGYAGPICETVLRNACDSYPCLNGGICMPIRTEFSCMCNQGYTGSTCEIPPSDGGVCPPGVHEVACFADPCDVTPCHNFPNAKCKSNYCGGCFAHFYDETGNPIAECNGCPIETCPTEWNPQCGTDDVTYSNPCRLSAAACLNPNLRLASAGECQSDCLFDACTAQYSPVCGSDGVSYTNLCWLDVAACRDHSIVLRYDGLCRLLPQDCPIDFCTEEYNPQCGYDGQTYSNRCYFQQAVCDNPNLKLAFQGECNPGCVFTDCPDVYDPQCGTDGQTYGNICELNSASCYVSTVRLAYKGKCGPVSNPWTSARLGLDGTYKFTVEIGNAGGLRGYTGITGFPSPGYAWYINGQLIPELVVQRGTYYIFHISGGRDNGFYITNDSMGGFRVQTREERQNVVIYAGPVDGPLCEWRAIFGLAPDGFSSSSAFVQQALSRTCDDGEPGILVWKPDETTPDLLYYQSYDEEYVGWKIIVTNQIPRSSATMTSSVSVAFLLIVMAAFMTTWT